MCVFSSSSFSLSYLDVVLPLHLYFLEMDLVLFPTSLFLLPPAASDCWAFCMFLKNSLDFVNSTLCWRFPSNCFFPFAYAFLIWLYSFLVCPLYSSVLTNFLASFSLFLYLIALFFYLRTAYFSSWVISAEVACTTSFFLLNTSSGL